MESYRKMRTENAIELAKLLSGRNPDGLRVSGIVTDLQSLARKSHLNAERMCNGELPECEKCHGDGHGCKACGGEGYPALKREAKAVEAMRAKLAAFGLRVYEQGDPRGWPLYLIPADSGPASEDYSWYNSRGFAVCPH